MIRVTVINGPNLNLLGQREPAIYGSASLADVERLVRDDASEMNVAITWLQSNHEGELVDWVQRLPAEADGAILNLGAFTHTSLAIRDALLAVQVPFVEVHLSNLYRREAARHHSVSADLARGVVVGFGPTGYRLALRGLCESLAHD